MQEMSNLDYHYALRELRAAEGSRLENAYELSRNVFRFRFKSKGFDESLLADLNASRIHFAKQFFEPPKFPSSFAMFLRKRFRGRRLEKVSQLNFDRIIRLDFGGESIVIEAFKSGNVLALDAEGRILLPYHPEEYSARKLANGEIYSPPPQPKTMQFSPSELRGNYKAVSALSKLVSLAPFYLEEACARAGVKLSEKAGNITREQKQALAGAIPSLLEQELAPRVYANNSFSPFPLEKAGDDGFESFNSLCEALESYYGPLPSEAEPPIEEKQERALKQQGEAASKYAELAEKARSNADWINENYGLAEELIALARSHDSKELTVKARAKGLEFELNGKKLVLRGIG